MNEYSSLPERPSLEQLRNQARDLQRSGAVPKLIDAQREVARRYGFASWARLKRHVETLLGLKSQIDAFVDAAIAGRLGDADAILAANPVIREAPEVIALIGDVERIAQVDPLAAFGSRGWTALLYVCFSRYNGRDDRRPALAACAEDLLGRGADPNAFWINAQFPEPPETCAYGVCGFNNHPAILRLLLDAGANPDDGEAMYHGCELGDLEGLRMLLEAGGNPKRWNTLPRMLDHEKPEGLRLVLDHWGGPDEGMARGFHHALIRGRGPWATRILLEYGADPNVQIDGVTAYARALLLNRDDHAALMREHGVIKPLSEAEHFLAACVRHESWEGPPPGIPSELQWVLAMTAGSGNVPALARMLDAGMPIDSRGEGDRTALTYAAISGQVEAVRFLIQRGADLEAKDRWYGGTPLSFALFCNAHERDPHGDYLGVCEALLAAGATCGTEWADEQTRQDPEMRDLLRRFGVPLR